MSQTAEVVTGELINTIEAAKVLGVSPKTLEKWRSTGERDLPYLKNYNHRVFYDTSVLAAFKKRMLTSHGGTTNATS